MRLTQLLSLLIARMQEMEYGGLKPEVRAQLREMANGGKSKPRRTFKMKTRPPAGTRLMRDYGGSRHFVTVLVRGFEYQGIRVPHAVGWLSMYQVRQEWGGD